MDPVVVGWMRPRQRWPWRLDAVEATLAELHHRLVEIGLALESQVIEQLLDVSSSFLAIDRDNLARHWQPLHDSAPTRISAPPHGG